jgi:hypothetical protein
MRKLAFLILIAGPIACWAQSDSTPINAASAPAREASKTSSNLNSGGKFDNTLEQVRDRLGLTPEQQPLWRAYQSKIEAYTDLYYRQKPVLASQEDTAVRQIGRLVDSLQNRLASLEDVERAARNLCASLTPEQQKTANQMLLLTIPTFGTSAVGASPPKEETRRKDGRADGGSRSHRTGGMGGGNF